MIGRFLKLFAPQILILMETEIWPNVMAACAARRIPVALVNARLSERSLTRAIRLGSLMTTAASQLTCVGAQTEADAQRIRSLGVSAVTVTGSIKFDVTPPPLALAAGKQLRAQIGARAVLLCASTRDGEEALILRALADTPLPLQALLLIVPRHPQRFDEVAALIQSSGLTLQRRSTLGSTQVDADVLLGDTMGEMFAYCAACDLAFVGGSLLPLGGQNPLEPCAAGKPVLFGPHTFNFALASEQAISAGAALRITDAAAMLYAADSLLRDPARCQAMGSNALRFAEQGGGATVQTLALLRPLLDAPMGPG